MKTIIITWVSKGLWYALAEKFLAEGYAVVGLSRTKPDLAIEHITADLTDKDEIQLAIKTIKEKYSDFACLINNIGDGKAEKIDEVSFDTADWALKINLLAPMVLTTGLIWIIKKNEADVINIGATIGFKGYEHFTAYSSAKWGLRWLTENLQVELKKTKCRVIGIHPWWMETPGNIWEQGRQEQMNVITWENKTNVFMNPNDIAQIVYNAFVTPKNIEMSEIIINRK
jgi:NADP-dependent 3-hydroxy acid dehydrogenase YdfG